MTGQNLITLTNKEFSILNLFLLDKEDTIFYNISETKEIYLKNGIEGLAKYFSQQVFLDKIYQDFSFEDLVNEIEVIISDLVLVKSIFTNSSGLKSFEDLTEENKIDLVDFTLQKFINDLSIIEKISDEVMLEMFNKNRLLVEINKDQLFEEYQSFTKRKLNLYFSTCLKNFLSILD